MLRVLVYDAAAQLRGDSAEVPVTLEYCRTAAVSFRVSRHPAGKDSRCAPFHFVGVGLGRTNSRLGSRHVAALPFGPSYRPGLRILICLSDAVLHDSVVLVPGRGWAACLDVHERRMYGDA